MSSTLITKEEVEKIVKNALSSSPQFQAFATELNTLTKGQEIKQNLQSGILQSGKYITSAEQAQPSVGLTAEQIAQQNAVIRRLEGDLYELLTRPANSAATVKQLQDQLLKIANHLRLYPGTTSAYIDIFSDVIAKMQGGARKSKKTRKSKTKQMKRKGKGKAKKSLRRRHHSKSK